MLISDMKFEMEKGNGREGGMVSQSRAAAHKKRSISLCIGGGRELFTRNRRRTEGEGREMMRCLARISKDESGTQADNYWRISRSDYHYYGALRGSA